MPITEIVVAGATLYICVIISALLIWAKNIIVSFANDLD